MVNDLTDGHQQALAELREVSAATPAALEIVRVHPRDDSGWLPIELSLATADASREGAETPASGPRAKFRARERFIVHVPPRFPFDSPKVCVTHTRFAGLPHVQWQHWICLYVSPITEWNPTDGIFGFLERLVYWIDQAAAGTLDPIGAPLHPPVAYASSAGGVAVIYADTPPLVADKTWLGFAIFKQTGGKCVDLVGWLTEDDAVRLLEAPAARRFAELTGIETDLSSIRLGPAVLLAEPTTFEFPSRARSLIDMLVARGVNRDLLLDILACASYLTRHISHRPLAAPQALHLVVGTPMRGIAGSTRKQHLAVWRLPDELQPAMPLLEQQYSSTQTLVDNTSEVRSAMNAWVDLISVDWAQVYEQRPEVTVRRDYGSALEWVRGRTIAIVGCGALGGHIAEHLVRAGVSCLLLMDNGTVSPGVLVRQPYDEADIGAAKVDALRRRLHCIRHDVKVDSSSLDALRVIFDGTSWPPPVDLIIDAAANPAITAAMERQRRLHAHVSPALLTVLIGHTAHHGLAMLAPQRYSGGGIDLLRKTKMRALATPELRPLADEFFPNPPRATYFQPEPGCSEATFVGSHAEVSALAAALLTHTCGALMDARTNGACGQAVLVDLGLDGAPAIIRQLSWPTDMVLQDRANGHEVRIATAALAEIRAECRLMARRRSWRTETGGILLGEVDDACGVVWISSASGPPPDSRASEQRFICGIEGVEALMQRHRMQTRGAAQFVGLWHSHPGGQAAPSPMDDQGMEEVVVPVAPAPRCALLLIVGAAESQWTAWLGEGNEAEQSLPELYVRLSRRRQAVSETLRTTSSTYFGPLASTEADETRRWPHPRRHGSPQRRWRRRWRWSNGA